MVKQIAQQLFDWIKEAGPTNGDAFDQDRNDEVSGFLFPGTESRGPCPIPLSPGEEALAAAHSDEIAAALEVLMDRELELEAV
jgi:hypothetical protein